MSTTTVRQWLLEHTPLEPSLLEGAGFDSLVAERIAAVGHGDEAAYLVTLDRSADEVERLAADIAVPETWLFRYPRSFELLDDILRRRVSGAAGLRMCSIGCATGLEAYSMAMAAKHAGWAPERVQIDALDRNPAALAIAAAGVYGPSSIRGEIPGWAAASLDRDAGAIRIGADIRAMVRFVRVDVTASRIEGPYDVIFCRNVLIYLNAGARSRLVREICLALAPDGVLFVGHAEQFLRDEPMLRPIAAPHAFALQRVDASAEAGVATIRPASAAARTAAPRPVTPVSARPATRPRTALPTPPAAHAPRARADRDDLLEARDLADAGRMAESEEMARSIIARGGPTAAALELLGLIRMSANDAAGAKRMFEQAVYLQPDRTASLLQLAMISERAGNAQRASMYWERARRASGTQENGA